MGKKKESVLLCPNCGSLNVHSDLSKDMVSWGGSTRYVCDDCGHSAILFPLVPLSQVNFFKRKIKNRKKSIKESRLDVGTPNRFLSKTFVGYNALLLFALIAAGYFSDDRLFLYLGLGFLIPIVLIAVLSRFK